MVSRLSFREAPNWHIVGLRCFWIELSCAELENCLLVGFWIFRERRALGFKLLGSTGFTGWFLVGNEGIRDELPYIPLH